MMPAIKLGCVKDGEMALCKWPFNCLQEASFHFEFLLCMGQIGRVASWCREERSNRREFSHTHSLNEPEQQMLDPCGRTSCSVISSACRQE